MSTRTPISMLSLVDFNGDPLPDDQLRESFDALMAEHGYVQLVNVHHEFDPVAFCRDLGTFVPQYGGLVVGDIRPEPGMEDVYHAGNTQPLFPHTEGYDFAGLPPRYIALWCVAPASGPGGETTLADGYRWIDRLEDDRVSEMSERVYQWKTTDGVMRKGLTLNTEHPLLERTEDGTILRFSTNNLLHDTDDTFAGEVIASGRDFFSDEHIAVNYSEGDMLVWDNWRVMHARNAFNDKRRHLKRIQVGAAAPAPQPAAAPA
jgi:alpha-ketoglutarate-dependent taurine dioxygenase